MMNFRLFIVPLYHLIVHVSVYKTVLNYKTRELDWLVFVSGHCSSSLISPVSSDKAAAAFNAV